MKNTLFRLLLLTGFGLLTNFAPPEKQGTNAALVGKWSKDPNAVWEFRADRSYTMSMADGKASISGTYSVRGNMLMLSDLSATGQAKACDASQKGFYIFAADSYTLTLSTQNDDCPARNRLVPGTYNRK
ncbi:hypothetical protein [Hymenobacter sp. BT491]|uniref:hypothetical protein n=1 Tax=Hymenobacter sp. BT491 TaxID=2766779 RepID=UPI0016537452|nr:hypothetical protein [Hymenobacter sp. BT491]MBC6990933.1 hypothetical protein [Hymenobacter sp. BT491]